MKKKSVSKMFLWCILRGLFFGKSGKCYKNWISGGDFEMLFLHKKRSKSFILSIYTSLEFTMFEKMTLFFVLILKWYVYMVFLKWCVYMVFLYNFLRTWQQGHIEVYKQHVHMVILFDFFRLNDNSGFSRCFFFRIIISQILIKILPKWS